MVLSKKERKKEGKRAYCDDAEVALATYFNKLGLITPRLACITR
jgi:hypothetical protein